MNTMALVALILLAVIFVGMGVVTIYKERIKLAIKIPIVIVVLLTAIFSGTVLTLYTYSMDLVLNYEVIHERASLYAKEYDGEYQIIMEDYYRDVTGYISSLEKAQNSNSLFQLCYDSEVFELDVEVLKELINVNNEITA